MRFTFPLLIILIVFNSVTSEAQQEWSSLGIDSLISTANYPSALKAIELQLTKPDSENRRCILENKKLEVFIAQGKLAEAEILLAGIQPGTDLNNAITLTNAGFLQLNKGRYDLALKYLKEAYAIFQSLDKVKTKEGIQTLAHLTSVYLTTGQYKQAEENERIVLQLTQELVGENSEEVAASYTNLGLIYLSRQPAKALDFYSKALIIYKQIHPATHPKIAISSTNLGIAYVQLNLYGDAINEFETARNIWKTIYPQGHPNVALVLRNLGRTYSKLNNYAAAIQYYNEAILIYRKAYGARHPDLAGSLNERGTLHLNANKYDLALNDFQHALAANSLHFSEEAAMNDNPNTLEYYNPLVLIYSLHLKASALEAKYTAKTLRLEELKLALRCLFSSDSLIDNLRYQRADEEDKITLGALASDVYESGVRIAFTISENVLVPQPYLAKAFYFAEKSKSAVLQAAIADTQAKAFAGIPAALLEEEKAIKSTLTQLNQRLAQKPNREEEYLIRQELLKNNSYYYSFVKKLEADYPRYFDLKFNTKAYQIKEIQNALTDSTALLSYFLADSSKNLFTFIITRTGFDVKSHSLPNDFDRLLRGFKNSIVFSEPITFDQTCYPISTLLIPRLPVKVKELIIIPSGKLSIIPFEALLLKSLKENDFKKGSYLINKFAVGYQFAANLVVQKHETQSNKISSAFLIAPVRFSNNEGLADLPGTAQEVTAIAGLFDKRATYAFDQEANEELIKSIPLTDFDYLHFATHGIMDENNPQLSRLFFTSQEQEDGLLYAGEIYNLTMNARLAVLSACQTGLGKFSKGEGVMGLSRALLYAGVKNSIVSFWSVADESTTQLMTDFYTFHLGESKLNFSHALQQAKLKMAGSERFASPYYWAPFVLIGKE